MTQDLTRPSLSDALTERVLELIRSDGLRAGDRLPSVRELAERFAVTAPTLREALRRLEATGAVRMRHGSGVYVGAGLERVVIPNPNVRRLAGGQLLQLLDARLLIEPPLAAMAARRADPADLARLRSILEQAGQHLRGEDAELNQINMTFHRAAAHAAGNDVLDEVIASLLSLHATEQREILRLFDDRVRDHEEHLAILAAIEDGDARAAEELMRTHLTDVKRVIEKRLD
ncbi:FadR/GntR family transcriptional regulator [Actinomadura kijaniata]|nr:FCD domain-containing protein [Actinomadura kijaniata]